MRFFRFIGGRLLRAAISLILFQIILFSLIQALPQDLAELKIAVFSQSDLSQFEGALGEDPGLDAELSVGGELPLSPELGELPSGGELALEEEFPSGEEPSLGPELVLGEDAATEEQSPPGQIEPPAKPDSKVQQFINWMTRFYRGDLGASTNPRKGAVADLLVQRLPKSLLLLLPASVVGFILGIWLGKIIAWRRRGWLEFAATLGGTAFYTSFPPWLAFVAINIIAFSLGWLPPEKLIDPLKWLDVSLSLNQAIMRLLITMGAAGIAYALVEWTANKYAWYRSWIRAVGAAVILILASIPWIVSGLAPQAIDLLYHLALPFITLVLLSFGETMLVMRTAMVEEMEADHVPVALARGLPENIVRDRHVARVAILPVLTRFVVHLPLIIVGSFVIERVFFWDGMGQVLIDAARDNDLPILLGVLSLAAIGILAAHVILDIVTRWLDPRLRRIEAPS